MQKNTKAFKPSELDCQAIRDLTAYVQKCKEKSISLRYSEKQRLNLKFLKCKKMPQESSSHLRWNIEIGFCLIVCDQTPLLWPVRMDIQPKGKCSSPRQTRGTYEFQKWASHFFRKCGSLLWFHQDFGRWGAMYIRKRFFEDCLLRHARGAWSNQPGGQGFSSVAGAGWSNQEVQGTASSTCGMVFLQLVRFLFHFDMHCALLNAHMGGARAGILHCLLLCACPSELFSSAGPLQLFDDGSVGRFGNFVFELGLQRWGPSKTVTSPAAIGKVCPGFSPTFLLRACRIRYPLLSLYSASHQVRDTSAQLYYCGVCGKVGVKRLHLIDHGRCNTRKATHPNYSYKDIHHLNSVEEYYRYVKNIRIQLIDGNVQSFIAEVDFAHKKASIDKRATQSAQWKRMEKRVKKDEAKSLSHRHHFCR